MKKEQAKIVADKVFKDIFGIDNPFTLDQIKEKFTKNINLPVQQKCAMSGEEIWVHNPQSQNKHISPEAFLEQYKVDGWMKPKQTINNIEDVLKCWEKVNYLSGNKIINSDNVDESDSIIGSSNIYHSSLIQDSKNVVFCHNDYYSNFMLASEGNNSCNYGFRLFDSIYTSSSYEVRWSKKVSKSMFINDSDSLYECMFCSGLQAKKYCIANIQFSEEEYFRIKKMVIDWIIKNA